MTIEAVLDVRRIGHPALAPDGRKVAFSVARGFAVPGEAPRSQIWISPTDGEASAATDGPGVDVGARWSPDARLIAFASDRGSPGLMSLHVLDVGTGEVTRLGTTTGSVEELAWSSDGRSLLVVAADVGSHRAGVATEIDDPGAAGPDPRVRRPAQAWRRLYRVELAGGETTEVGPDGATVWEIDWDGGNLVAAVLSTDPSESGWYRANLAVVDLRIRAAENLHVPDWQIAGPRLSPDGRHVAFLEGICSDRGSLTGTPMFVGTGGGPATEVAGDLEVTSIAWRDDAALWYSGRRGVLSTCGWLSLDGRVVELWAGEAAVRHLSVSADGGVLAAVVETLVTPPEVAVLETAGPERPPERGPGPSPTWRRVTSLNASCAGLDLPRTERLVWEAPDGWRIEGLLVRPYRPGQGPPPLVVLVHGGPTVSWSYAFPCGVRHAALLADAGYAVLLPNPRGSSGRGQAFARAVVEDLGGAELTDTLAGVDTCVAAGLADGERVGIMGASHGGFMAAWAVTQTPRFRAAIAVACVSDYLSCHYTSNIAGLDDMLFGGLSPRSEGRSGLSPRIAAYLERSPVAHAARCTTPTLVVHGEEDRCCPLGQAQELYGALVEAGVETELVVYPREGHGLVEGDHQVDLWRRVHDWFDRHLAAAD
ncbi:MAG: S9 family peptidase [Acidimicrobiales bacterium]